MAFINEQIPASDLEKYGIVDINDEANVVNFESMWTVDRERNIYLRWMSPERGQPGRNNFTFYWKGFLFFIALKRDGNGIRGGKGTTIWSIWPGDGEGHLHLPISLETERVNIIADLKTALTAFKEFGVYTTTSEHTAYFEF